MPNDVSTSSLSRNPVAARGSAAGLRTIAMFEATKGVLVLLVGLGLLSIVHRNAQNVGEEIVRHFHLNLAHRTPRIFTELAMHLDDTRLRLLALAAVVYSVLRLVEAYGLWRRRAWAEWFAIISGGVYLPVELYELIHRATIVKFSVFIINAVMVAYLVYGRRYRRDLQDNTMPA